MRSSNDAGASPAIGVAPNGLNKKQLSRERSLETILRTALTVMVKKGYRNTTIDQIADASGFTKGAVYHYFESKEELLMTVLDMVEQDVITHDEPAAEDGALASEQLVSFLHSQALRALERADSFLFLVTLAGDFSNLGDTVGTKIDGIFRRLGDSLKRIVLAGQKSGQFSREMSAEDLRHFYVSVFTGNVLLWHRSGRLDALGRSQVRAMRIAFLSVLTQVDAAAPAP